MNIHHCGACTCVAYLILGSLLAALMLAPTAALLLVGFVCISEEERKNNPNTCGMVTSNTVAYSLIAVGFTLVLPNLVCLYFSTRCFCMSPNSKVAPSEEEEAETTDDVIYYRKDGHDDKKEKDPEQTDNDKKTEPGDKNAAQNEPEKTQETLLENI